MKEYLTIGEIAQIFQMDVQLLRHYDARGLLVPALRNEENGRRLYRFDQVYPLATIRYLRKLGYSLNRIGEFVQNGNVDKNLETLVDQAALLRQQCAELMETVDIIQKKLDFVARESRDAGRDVYRVKTYPDRPFIRIGHYLNLYTHELYYFYPVVGFYQQGEKWFGAYLFDERASRQPKRAWSRTGSREAAISAAITADRTGRYRRASTGCTRPGPPTGWISAW